MPKGFLVKRQKHGSSYASWRARHNSEEDRTTSDSGSEPDAVDLVSYRAPHPVGSPDLALHYPIGSPDSGYPTSPLSLTLRPPELDTGRSTRPCSSPVTIKPDVVSSERYVVPLSPVSPPDSPSPPTAPTTGYTSPFYYAAFDRLSVSSPVGKLSPVSLLSTTPTSNPGSPSKKRLAEGRPEEEQKAKSPKKSKAARRIAFNEDNSSPVSGTIIRDAVEGDDGARIVVGDIEPSLNLVEVTPEARAELAKIENKLGEYVCRLCREVYGDAFQLAQHKCSRIVHVEYRCPECDKVFNCPANLASHRRWHKPRPPKPTLTDPRPDGGSDGEQESRGPGSPSSRQGDEGQFECPTCGKRFRRQAYLRKHAACHSDERPYPCQLCGKPFRTEAARNKHVLQHTVGAQPATKDLPCSVCGMTFSSKQARERHERTHTTEVFSCKYCPSRFYSSPGLTRHINKYHPSENRQVIILQMPVNRPCWTTHNCCTCPGKEVVAYSKTEMSSADWFVNITSTH